MLSIHNSNVLSLGLTSKGGCVQVSRIQTSREAATGIHTPGGQRRVRLTSSLGGGSDGTNCPLPATVTAALPPLATQLDGGRQDGVVGATQLGPGQSLLQAL